VWRAVVGMGLRGWLKRIEQDARGHMGSFVLEDGTRHYYYPMSGELFLHMCDCLRAQGEGMPFPEPPETVKAIGRAKDREAAFEQVRGGAMWELYPYEADALIERGEIVPRSLVHGHELGEGPLLDLSEKAKAKRGEE
jgi:hypothetical protein